MTERYAELIDQLERELFPFQESKEEQEASTPEWRKRVDGFLDSILRCPMCRLPRTCTRCRVRPCGNRARLGRKSR